MLLMQMSEPHPDSKIHFIVAGAYKTEFQLNTDLRLSLYLMKNKQ